MHTPAFRKDFFLLPRVHCLPRLPKSHRMHVSTLKPWLSKQTGPSKFRSLGISNAHLALFLCQLKPPDIKERHTHANDLPAVIDERDNGRP
jgi:hypothetical protein